MSENIAVNTEHDPAALIYSLVQDGKKLERSEDETARQNIINAASRLISQLENPYERLARIGWGEPTRTAALRIAFDLGLFRKLAMEPLSSAQLAEGTDADVELVARIMKHLASWNIVNEVNRDKYTATPFSLSTNDPIMAAGLIYSFEGMGPTFHHLPSFLAKTKYRVPTDHKDGPAQYGLNINEPFFDYLQDDTRLAGAFNKFMGGWKTSRPHWVDFYPCEERLIAGFSNQNGRPPLLVDVGGGLGHDINAFRSKFPAQEGTLILEDTPQVIDQGKDAESTPNAITVLAHDFFQPQPEAALGARAYFLRQILHDWPDERCRVILSHIRDAMTPGYSKLLINENMMVDLGATWQQTSLDWTMMAMHVGKERTATQFREMLEEVGLTVVSTWEIEGANENIIEAIKEEPKSVSFEDENIREAERMEEEPTEESIEASVPREEAIEGDDRRSEV